MYDKSLSKITAPGKTIDETGRTEKWRSNGAGLPFIEI